MNRTAPATILSSLKHFAELNPDKTVYTILDRDCHEIENVSFSQLYVSAKTVAYNLKARGLETGQPIALTATTGKEFIVVFLGCLLAGVIPVPLPSPRGKRQLERIKNIFSTHGFNRIIADSGTSALLTSESGINFIESSSLAEQAGECRLPTIEKSDVAFLQYTSGSTSQPKGVVVTHNNIITNEAYIYKGFGHNSDTVIVGWLPFHHDMGLIGNMLHPIYAGVHSVIMSPMDFLRKPANWLKVISKYRATTSGGPNFAYDLCVSSINIDDIEGIDLSSWQVAFNGSETIQERSINLFSEKFNSYGFSRKSFLFCYGLAEATLYVTGGKYDAEALHHESHKTNIGCGTTEGDTCVSIINPSTNEEAPDGDEGEIWVRGSSVASGYWKDAKNTEETFKAYTKDGIGPFMRTGDLGYFKDNNLFISGRLKDLIIIRGQNIHPVDIEAAIHNEIPALATYRSAIFSVREGDSDQLVIIHELNKKNLDDAYLNNLYKGIISRVSAEFQIDISGIAFVKENLLPRTTSGKIQVAVAKKMFLDKSFNYVSCRELNSSEPIAIQDLSIDSVVGALLGSKDIYNDVPLLEYGLDSIKAVQLIHLLEDKFSVFIELQTLLMGLSLGEIKKLIAKEEAGDKGGAVSERLEDIETLRDIQEAPLSYEQENIWIAQKLNPKDCSYNIPILIKVHGLFNPELFKQSIKDVLSTYQSLNITFEERSGAVFQVKRALKEIFIEQVDLFGIDPKNQKELIDKRYYEESSTPIDIESERCFRASFYSCSTDTAYLLLNFHHIVCDGWSFNLFKSDLVAAIKARLNGDKAVLSSAADLGIFEHALEQRRGLSNDSSRYWAEQLSGALPSPPLSPLWRVDANPLTVEHQGDELRFKLSQTQSKSVRSFCRKLNITPASVFLGLFHCLIHNYSREKVTLVNYVGANRQQSKYRNTFGCFVNTLISRGDFSPTGTLSTICHAVHTKLTENFKHESYPFVEVIRNNDKVTNFSGSALSRFFFVMQNAPAAINEIDGLSISLEPMRSLHAMYDFVLEVLPLDDTYDVKMEYRSSVIPSKLMTQYQQCFLTLINLLEAPGKLLYEESLGCLSLSRTAALKNHLSQSKSESFDIIKAFKRQVGKAPEKTALIDDFSRLCYLQLLEEVEKTSELIITTTGKRHCRVVLPCVRSNQYIINLLAVLNVGGCYIPLDFNQPEEALRRILNELTPDLILGADTILSKINGYEHLFVSDQSAKLPEVKQTEPAQLDEENAAYVIFTSGSTGKAKGIEVSRKSLNSFVEHAVSLFDVSCEDKILQFSALNWDTSSEEIYPCFVSGATLVLRSNNQVEHYEELIERSNRNQVSVWNLPSSYWQELAFYLQTKKADLPGSLRLIIVGGETVSQKTLYSWYKNHGKKVKLLNTYGATELTSISMACDLRDYSEPTIFTPHLPIGKPLGNTEAFILSESGASMPVGSVGILHFSGESLAIGYCNDECLTNEKFYYHDMLGCKVYNTGDYAYYDDEGVSFLVGRNDSYVKRRGVRVDLSMLASSVGHIDGVHYSTADYQRAGDSSGVISLFIVISASDLAPIRQKVNHVLSEQLTDHYKPDHVRYLNEIPRLANGKVDLKAFRENALPLYGVSRKMKLVTSTENKIANIWQVVLGHSDFNESSSFNQVGGNSLLILKLKSLIEEEFKVEIPVSELFSNASCVKQAGLVDGLLNVESISAEQDMFDLLSALENDQIDLKTVKKTLNI